MLVDSHCHLNMSDFSNDLEEIISNAKNNQIDGLLTICTELNELQELKEISKKIEIFGIVGEYIQIILKSI